MASVRLPSLLAQEAGGVRRHEVEAATVGEALGALPVADLLLDELGSVRPLVHVYVDGERERDLKAELGPNAEVIVVAAVAGG
jgi:sulfur-carrier protein